MSILDGADPPPPSHLEEEDEPETWRCDHCNTENHREWPTCAYCGRFKDKDVQATWDWYS